MCIVTPHRYDEYRQQRNTQRIHDTSLIRPAEPCDRVGSNHSRLYYTDVTTSTSFWLPSTTEMTEVGARRASTVWFYVMLRDDNSQTGGQNLVESDAGTAWFVVAPRPTGSVGHSKLVMECCPCLARGDPERHRGRNARRVARQHASAVCGYRPVDRSAQAGAGRLTPCEGPDWSAYWDIRFSGCDGIARALQCAREGSPERGGAGVRKRRPGERRGGRSTCRCDAQSAGPTVEKRPSATVHAYAGEGRASKWGLSSGFTSTAFGKLSISATECPFRKLDGPTSASGVPTHPESRGKTDVRRHLTTKRALPTLQSMSD